SFTAQRRLSSEVIQLNPLAKGGTAFSFSTNTIDGADELSDVLPIDFDLDLDDDLVTISESAVVQLWTPTDGVWSSAGHVQLDKSLNRLMVADLFMVDSSNPQRIKSESTTQGTANRDYSSDAKHDTFPGLIAYGSDGITLIAIDGRQSTASTDRLQIVDQKTGLEEVTGVTDVVTGDLEGDGDLDLAVATQSDGLRLFINRGNRTFFETTFHKGGFDSSDPIGDMAIADIDRDLDLDIVTVHPASGRVGVLENLLHLQFRGRLIDDIPPIENAASVLVAEVDGNVSWDLIVGGTTQTAVVFTQTADAGIWTIERVETSQSSSNGLMIADLDNDAWSELVTAGGVTRIGPWGQAEPQSIDLVTDLDDAINVASANVNGDGLLDLIAVVDGKLTVGINETQTSNHHLYVRFKGIADNNANSGRVNHFGVGSVLELRFGPHYQAQVITAPSTHFGLDGFDAASSVRVIMPNGLTQTIREPKIDAVVQEKQTLKGSCPYLYAWDGTKYEFVTDCLWAAPLGLQVSRGVVAKDRPWEYLMVDGSRIQPRDGRYSFRITEELWEVAYFDKVAVTAVDHPADVDVWTNEKVGPGNIAQQTVFAFGDDDIHALRAATDTRGRDVTKSLAAVDRDFVQGFDRRLRQGLCEPHWIDLDFGTPEIKPQDRVYLVLTGWILPTDTSLNIQIDQNPELPAVEFPSLWVPDSDANDGWRKAIAFMGFPGGKTKTIVVDVTETILKADPRLRVRTSAQIYWDSAELAIQSSPSEIRQQPMKLLDAKVAYHGFSQSIKTGETHCETYDYQTASHQPKWPPLRGELTRFGDCSPLISQWDDSMVVISSGDEIQMSFSVPSEPVPEGFKRDFIFHCVGWDKDADLNTLTGQTTRPLPFRAMTSYPPRADGFAQADKVQRQNDSHLRRHQSYRAFWYRPEW
ncbi:MAG: hypothetical protein HKN47_12970, partial [Pirellulaceae bacterium]|nr:hypothetical protein [Pirellulaceae bacterium]